MYQSQLRPTNFDILIEDQKSIHTIYCFVYRVNIDTVINRMLIHSLVYINMYNYCSFADCHTGEASIRNNNFIVIVVIVVIIVIVGIVVWECLMYNATIMLTKITMKSIT